MASTQTWSEGNGANAGTETTNRTDCNYKNVDDSTTAYSSSPITAGNNSFSKYQAIKFGGTFNTLSSLSYKISSNAPATGISIVGSVITAASPASPSTTATGDSAMSTTGLSANFTGTTWANVFEAGTATATAVNTYGQALRTQLQSTGSAAPGDIPSVTITATWTES